MVCWAGRGIPTPRPGCVWPASEPWLKTHYWPGGGGGRGGNSDQLTSGKCLHVALLKTLPGQHPLKSRSVTPALQALLFLEVSCLIIKNACESCLPPPPPKPGPLRNINLRRLFLGFCFVVVVVVCLFVCLFFKILADGHKPRYWRCHTVEPHTA